MENPTTTETSCGKKRTGKKRQREKTEEKKGPDGSETEEHLKRKKKCEEGATIHPVVSPMETSISLERFAIHKTLGQGSFGKVVLASDQITNKWLAMKIIDKQHLIESASSCLVERRVLEIAAGCKFLTHAYATFQTEVPTLLPYINPLFKQDRLFFAMEYLSGGDLYDYLDKNGRLDLSTTT
ncbi:kinase C delta type-like [Pelobates cultripes]|uniref:non-specific serine/threonine protein kinase n=1 Tax=Pelobates cultripes TaxID=61616 RepID=A0AAD1TSF9_PELCU|nr:kinase C delta type-like [Pelobates cultripes]